jgi:sugar O-acyltransferase (sialic acid O-acetyltransferase NeuD family)
MSDMSKIILIGSSGHAHVAIDVIESQGIFEITGLIDDFRPVGEESCGYPVLGKVVDIPEICARHGIDRGLVAVGDNFARSVIQKKIAEGRPQFHFVTAIHPSAIVSKRAELGAGVIVMPGAVINSGSIVGDSCIVNTHATLEHDSRMGEFSSLASGAVTGGNVQVGRFSAVGPGATLLNGAHIGEHTVIGAGTVVTGSIPAYRVAYGVPARIVRERMAGESYL